MTEAQNTSWRDAIWNAARKNRTLLFSSQVSDISVREMIGQLLALEAEDSDKAITLILNSPGGSVNDGYALVDLIRFIACPVRVVCTGLVASMGISLLLSVDKEQRFTLPHTRFMMHQPRFSGAVIGTASDLEITANEILKMKEKGNREVADATGQSYEKVDKDTSRDLWLNADEAVEYGLVSRVIQSVSEL
jgi:ATP-dependent Clp protease protease subunit